MIVGHAIEVSHQRRESGNVRSFSRADYRVQSARRPGVRVDTYVSCAGITVPPFYDSMIAEVIVHARTRDLAIARMRRALMPW